MQKHERTAIEAARAVAEPLGCTVEMVAGSRGHNRMVLRGPRGSRSVALSSSPRGREDMPNYARQWARRTVGEVA